MAANRKRLRDDSQVPQKAASFVFLEINHLKDGLLDAKRRQHDEVVGPLLLGRLQTVERRLVVYREAVGLCAASARQARHHAVNLCAHACFDSDGPNRCKDSQKVRNIG